jgi:cell division transport system permease protein
MIGQAGQGLRRNLTMTVAGVLTVMIALALLAGGLIVRSGSAQVKQSFFQQLNVSVYLDTNATTPQLDAIRTALTDLPQVQSIQYVSQTEAFALFKQYFSDQPQLIALTKASQLPPSYVVKLVNPQEFDVVEQAVAELPGVHSVSDASQRLAHVFTFLRAITIGALVLAVLALMATALLIYNAMQVSAFSRRRETGIMRLVGASNLSIQLPFIVEGSTIGAIGALLAFGLLMATRIWITDHVAIGVLSPFGDMTRWVETLPIIVVVGVGLSALMSFITLQRHLRV